MINSRRHYCRSKRIAFRELDSFAQDVSEVHKRSVMFNTRWKPADGSSCARISSTSGDIVAARWRRALRARAISKRACQEQFFNNQRLSFGAKPSPPPSHLAPKCQELSHAQISGWWRHRWGRPRTVRCIAASSPLSFFVAVGAIFFSPPSYWARPGLPL